MCCVCVCTYRHVLVEAEGWCQVSFLSVLFIEPGPSLFPVWLDVLISEPWEIASLPPQLWGYRQVWAATPGSGYKLRSSSCFNGKHFIGWAVSTYAGISCSVHQSLVSQTLWNPFCSVAASFSGWLNSPSLWLVFIHQVFLKYYQNNLRDLLWKKQLTFFEAELFGIFSQNWNPGQQEGSVSNSLAAGVQSWDPRGESRELTPPCKSVL